MIANVALQVNANERHRYAPLKPNTFKVGDIVEVAFSIVGIPIRGDRTMLMLNLRALTLLDDQVRKVCYNTAHQRQSLTVSIGIRRELYDGRNRLSSST